jgi:YVTN family beta-propeller protein
MARTNNNKTIALCTALTMAWFVARQADATRLPQELNAAILQKFAGARVRLDGSIETKQGEIFLPVVPDPAANAKTVTLEEGFPDLNKPDVLRFSNGWCYLRLFKNGVLSTVVSPVALPESLRKKLLSGKMPADLIVPGQVSFPRSLKPIIGDLLIPTFDDTAAALKTEPGQAKKAAAVTHDAVFVTSPKNGNIVLLDAHSLAKIAEFSTEGTPSGMAAGNGKLYITDQAKGRVLVFDLKRREFTGNVVLAPHSAPKGVCILPNAKLLYVSESAANDVAVVETATEKVLLRTRVPAGPARMVMSPNGFDLIVLNVPAGLATIMSTTNQRVLGSVPVGSMPNAVVMSSDSLRAYVSNRMSNTVSVIDVALKRVIATIRTGSGPTGLALSPDGTKLYVANAKDNTIDAYDLKTRQSVGEVRLPLDVDFPGTIVLTPDGKQLVMSSESTEALGILNLENMQFAGQPVIGQTSDDVLWVQFN